MASTAWVAHKGEPVVRLSGIGVLMATRYLVQGHACRDNSAITRRHPSCVWLGATI
jgi:hypothetical protein